MATRNIPWYSTYNYWPVANLTALGEIPTDTLDDGCLIYVQNIKTSFNLDKNSTLTPEGNEVIAAHDGGNWIKSALNSETIASFDNLAALTAEPTEAKQDNIMAYVITLKAYFKLTKTSTITADGITIITALNGGRWIRQIAMYNPEWLYQTSWYFDPAAGDSENSGADPAHPLDTWAEFIRRVSDAPLFSSSIDIIIMSNMENETISFNPQTYDYNNIVTISGIPISPVRYSGTMTTYTRDITTNNCGTIADNSLNIADNIGYLVEFDQPEPAHVYPNVWAKYCYILKDLGGGQARVSTVVGPIWTGSSWNYSVLGIGTPTNGITYDVLSFPRTFFGEIGSKNNFASTIVKNLDLIAAGSFNTNYIRFLNCRMVLEGYNADMRGCYYVSFDNCAIGGTLFTDASIGMSGGFAVSLTFDGALNGYSFFSEIVL